ncbi:MAG TPA: hypothetical protein VFC76_09345 [Oscillospiraceae bacterium]|nr:hypothetical protein [Oscillospiraceae bacterium]
MNILSKRNGLALVAVIALLMILTFLVPAMLTYADTATVSAMQGTSRQKAIYLARTGVEMAVASFKNTYGDMSLDDDEDDEVDETATAFATAYKNLLNGGELNSETIYLFLDTTAVNTIDESGSDIEEDGKHIYTTDYDSYKNNSKYKYVGKVDVKITRKDETHVFKIDENGESHDICCDASYAADFQAACSGNVNNPIAAPPEKAEYSYVKERYAQFDFVGISEVNGIKSVKKASALDTINTADNGWTNPEVDAVSHENGVLSVKDIGLELIAVNPDNASSKQKVTYRDGTASGGINKTVEALIYSAYGNIVIDTNAKYPTREQLNTLAGMKISQHRYDEMVNTMPIYLGCKPNMNYYREEQYGNLDFIQCVTLEDNRDHSFVAFAATNAIQVNIPINVSVNPIRTSSLEPLQGSVYKMMLFQANDIIFKKSIINSAMFTWANNDLFSKERGKRFGSVILTATESTPFSYYNISRQEFVKAGRVTFLEDVYLVYIPYGKNSGRYDGLFQDETYGNWNKLIYQGQTGIESRKSRYNKVSDTEVKYDFATSSCIGYKNLWGIRLEGYHVTKLFNAGDVYLFNAEIEATVKDKKQIVGMNVMTWWAETYYLPMIDLHKEYSSTILTIINNWFVDALYEAFGITYNEDNTIYKADDMHYIGNIYEDVVAPPDLSSMLYVLWDS